MVTSPRLPNRADIKCKPHQYRALQTGRFLHNDALGKTVNDGLLSRYKSTRKYTTPYLFHFLILFKSHSQPLRMK